MGFVGVLSQERSFLCAGREYLLVAIAHRMSHPFRTHFLTHVLMLAVADMCLPVHPPLLILCVSACDSGSPNERSFCGRPLAMAAAFFKAASATN